LHARQVIAECVINGQPERLFGPVAALIVILVTFIILVTFTIVVVRVVRVPVVI